MKKRYVFRDFLPVIREEKVFQLLKCSEESETYETFREEYRELSPEVKEAMEALAVVCLEEERMYVFLTVGEKISALASSYFNSGDYVKGMLADAMADTLLFEVEHQLMAELKEIAAEWKVGVKARLEAPGRSADGSPERDLGTHEGGGIWHFSERWLYVPAGQIFWLYSGTYGGRFPLQKPA